MEATVKEVDLIYLQLNRVLAGVIILIVSALVFWFVFFFDEDVLLNLEFGYLVNCI